MPLAITGEARATQGLSDSLLQLREAQIARRRDGEVLLQE